MSTAIADDSRKVTTHRLYEMKQRGEKIAMLTAYDYSMAQIIDRAGMDVILVGDSASNVMAGNITTLPITLDQMIYHGKSVVKAVRRALVVVDLPFGSYQGNSKEALASAIRVMKQTHADCIKMEGGAEIRESIQRVLCAGIPIMGHLGLTPQSINKFGTYTVRAREEAEAAKLVEDARLLEELGCFALVLEKIPADLATRVASELRIPVIGIGAGGGVDGQVLVMHDMLGINQDFSPRFLRRYADLNAVITAARDRYLCGGARIKEALDVITGGWCPVVVDVGGLTTHAVLLDENGSWTTKEAETVSRYSMGKDPRTALTTIMMGPALLDDEYAYLTIGALILSSPSTEDPSSYDHSPEGATCPVVVAKVRLSDAFITNVATVAENYSAENVESIRLSFSADRSSLIMTGEGEGDESSATQPPENYIALRLSAADLSVELDARSILEDQYITHISFYGQAIGYKPATASTSIIMFLGNGEHESTGGALPIIVRDDWYYYRADTTDEQGLTRQGLTRNVSSGQTVVLTGRTRSGGGRPSPPISRRALRSIISTVPIPLCPCACREPPHRR